MTTPDQTHTATPGSLHPDCSATYLLAALEASVKLQSHYAKLLNMHDGGRRIGFKTAAAWIKRLREIGTLPNAKLSHGLGTQTHE